MSHKRCLLLVRIDLASYYLIILIIFMNIVLQTAEDCLFMNIFVPLSATPTSKLAVMLFLHGGNFVNSCGSSMLYDGQYWVNTTNVILVTINYRMGAYIVFFSFRELRDVSLMSVKWSFPDNISISWYDPNRY